MDKIFNLIWAKKLKLIGTFFLVFLVSYLFLVAIDFLPEAPENTEATETSGLAVNVSTNDNSSETQLNTEPETEEVNEPAVTSLPVEINIPKIGKNIKVLNPTSRNISDLDKALLDGVVRHPDSASLGQEGNVFILGHSSYLPNVFNKNFQAFNGIQELAWGDKIEIFSNNQLFEYRVEKVYKASAQDTTVPIAGTGHKLTLATCNSFGSVDDRWIVEAKRVSVITI
jgi:LPXTG-site transpeptidase (sortase) family protein